MREHDYIDPNQVLEVRIRELRGKARLIQLRTDIIESTLQYLLENPSPEVVGEAAQNILQQTNRVLQIYHDFAWIQTLRKTGIPPELILKIWDARESEPLNINDLFSDF